MTGSVLKKQRQTVLQMCSREIRRYPSVQRADHRGPCGGTVYIRFWEASGEFEAKSDDRRLKEGEMVVGDLLADLLTRRKF